ncbi:ABC transporter ATP-binding protein [Gordonia terrae]|uniref:ABC transporter ATP-binding protein n=1 Tax=Gordonia terrae TaxID=2055 RepID=UPI003F6CBD8F
MGHIRSFFSWPRRTPEDGFSATRAILRIVAPQRVPVAVGLSTAIGAVALALVQPLAAGQVVAHVSEPAFGMYIALLIGLMVVYAAVETVSGYFLDIAGERATLNLRRDFTKHILALPMRTIETMRLGDLISRATADTTLVKNLASYGLVRLTTGVLGATGGAVLMFGVDPLLCLVALGSMAVAGVVLGFVAPRIQKIAIRSQESVGEITADLERALSELRTVKANQTEEFEVERITRSIDRVFGQNRHSARLVALGNPVIRLATTASLVIILIVGGAQVASGEAEPAHLVTIMLYAIYLAGPVSDVFDAISQLQRGLAALRRLAEVEAIDVESVYPPAEGNRASYLTHTLDDAPPHQRPREPKVSNGLAFDSVSFSYPGGAEKVLDTVTFGVDIGEHAGLMGVSGAGKSTVFALACRLYEADSGTISIAGSNLSSISLRQARSLVGLVDQHAPILYGTLRENFRYGNDTASDADIEEIAERVNLTTLVRSLPQGLDSPVGEHGSLVSGGERQRIALGRALLGSPTVLLLDEPTAMLDAEAEASLIDVLADVQRSCAILTISHKRSTLKACDTLWKLENGKLELSTTLDHDAPAYGIV